jgi:hypothetical protein
MSIGVVWCGVGGCVGGVQSMLSRSEANTSNDEMALVLAEKEFGGRVSRAQSTPMLAPTPTPTQVRCGQSLYGSPLGQSERTPAGSVMAD